MSTDVTYPEVVRPEESLSVEVIEAVAATKGVDVMALETTLYEVVDPDALEQLFEPLADGTPRTGGKLVLEIAGCEVVVRATGDVEVERTTAPDGSELVARTNDR